MKKMMGFVLSLALLAGTVFCACELADNKQPDVNQNVVEDEKNGTTQKNPTDDQGSTVVNPDGDTNSGTEAKEDPMLDPTNGRVRDKDGIIREQNVRTKYDLERDRHEWMSSQSQYRSGRSLMT